MVFNTQTSFNVKDQTLMSLLSLLCLFKVTAVKIVTNVGSFCVCQFKYYSIMTLFNIVLLNLPFKFTSQLA